MINLKELEVKYQKLNNPTLKSINLQISNGQKVLILGPSGSGKSTLGKVLNGLIPNSINGQISGQNTIDNLHFGEASIFELSTKIGTIMQDQDSQFVGLNVAEDIAFYLENLAIPVDLMHKKVDSVIDILEVNDIKDTDPSRLSGGEKQKVSLAGVLVNDVDTLLLDEPLANLDPKSSIEVMELIKKINKDLSKTIIMIEHRLEDALIADFDVVVVIEDGQIIFNDTPNELLKSDILKQVGVRKPLYLEALDKLQFDYQTIANVLDYNSFDLSNLKFDIQRTQTCVASSSRLLEVNSLNFSYGDHLVLQDVNFSVGKGEIVSLLGANGTGKSTLCDTIIGINKDYDGTITIDSASIDNMSITERSHLIGYVMQNPNHYITETLVGDEVAFTLRDSNLSNAQINEKVDLALSACRLTKFKKWPINMLSYGQRRRVTIAAALVRMPKMIILDEPTAGQDYDTFKSIMDTVSTLRNQFDISILVITHNMQIAYEYSDRALVLGKGKIQYDGQIDKLYENHELLDANNLRTTSIQEFARVTNISAHDLGQVLIGGDN